MHKTILSNNRESSLQQNRHCHRHNHQPEAIQRSHWWEEEAVLYLRRHRSEEVHRGSAGEEADWRWCHEVHHRGVCHRLRCRPSAVPGPLLWLLHGRVLQRQWQARPDHLWRSVQAGKGSDHWENVLSSLISIMNLRVFPHVTFL